MRTFATRPLAFTALVLLLAPRVHAEDELRVRQLENEVMRLERALDAQSQRIDNLERSSRSGPAPAASAIPRPSNDSPAWLVTSNWERVRPGMKELEVIAVLGRPTSARVDTDGKSRTLFYALELGPNALLAGNVRIGDAGVAEINRPKLR